MPLPNEKPATAVYDKGRRGEPLQGCDCVQCFGYCMVDGDEADRLRSEQTSQLAQARHDRQEGRSSFEANSNDIEKMGAREAA